MSEDTTKDTATDKDGSDKDAASQPLTTHLEELRSRLIKCFLVLIVGFGVAYGFSQHLLDFVAAPLAGALPDGGSLAMIKVTEGFMTHLKLALLAGLFASCPMWFYHAWKFVAPGLYPHERRYVWPFVIGATFFFLVGASFAYYIVLPWGLQFLLGYATGGIHSAGSTSGVAMNASISIEAYLGFFTRISLAFGFVFEMPVVIFFLARMGLVHHKTLSKGRGIAVVVIFIVAAFLTPPDVFTQLMMAAPLWVLYELSIIVARIFGQKSIEEQEAEEAKETAEEA
jgi:sec-independent protein translocase protein TatC